jgi:Flp pilus assembly pilin Flp
MKSEEQTMQAAATRPRIGVERFLRDERGTTSIEYALLASGIAVAIASVVVSAGSSLRDDLYQKILDAYPS